MKYFGEKKIKSDFENETLLHQQSIYRFDTTGLTYMPKRILSIDGDFDGDGNTEILSEYYFDINSGKQIKIVPENGSLEWLYCYHSMTYLVSNSDKISPLEINDDSWGLLSLLNLNDVNEDGIDEVAVVSDNADYSSLATCWIYQFCNGVWKVIFIIQIHEQAFWYPDNFDTSIFYEAIPGFLEKKNDRWYYYDNDDYWGEGKYLDSTGYPVLHPLRIRKKCDCLPEKTN